LEDGLEAQVRAVSELVYRFGPPPGGAEEEDNQSRPGPSPLEREDLPYKVELWDDARAVVEQVLAVTANSSIGYAAFYAATRDFPRRLITLRHKNRVVSRWTGQAH
jgi:hypothetical protein